MKHLGLNSILISAAALTGCMSYDSPQVATDEMALNVTAEAHADGSMDVLAQLTVHGPGLAQISFVDLDPEVDRLVAKHGTRSVQMQEEFVVGLGIYQYRAIFDDAEVGEMVNVSLEREELDDAPRSRARVPAPFTLEAMPITVGKSEGIKVSWTGGSEVDESRLSLASGCLETDTAVATGNPGELTIAGSRLAYRQGADVTQPCQVELTVTLVNEGAIDAAYGLPGSVEVVQTQAATLTVQP